MLRRSSLPWLLVGLAVAAFAAAVCEPESVARRLGLGDRVAERQQEAWRHRMRAHLRRLDAGTPAGATIFIGASTIQGLSASRVRACSVSFGVGGETADQLVGRLGDYSAFKRASAIVVMAGLNDVLKRDNADLATIYRRLLAGLPAATPVILSSLPRLAERRRGDAVAVLSANAAARAACAVRPGCRFVDLHGAMSAPSAFLEPDGIHLNSAGYALWSRLLRDSLAAAGVSESPCMG